MRQISAAFFYSSAESMSLVADSRIYPMADVLTSIEYLS